MPGREEYLRINTDEVAAEVMDGEAVLINLSNGMYYNTEGVGGLVWQLIEAGRSVGEIADALAAQFGTAKDAVEADLQSFCGQLLEEGLVAIGSDRPVAGAEAVPDADGEYAAPRLNVYRDMGDLLALDPPMPGLKDIPWKEPVDAGQD